jgi:hypothetical protein
VKVAFVHDWLVTYRGGEKVLDALISLYPDAPIYTLFYDRSSIQGSDRTGFPQAISKGTETDLADITPGHRGNRSLWI